MPVDDVETGPMRYRGSEGSKAAAIKSETFVSSAVSLTTAASSSAIRGMAASSSAMRDVAAPRFRSSADVSGHSQELELQNSVRLNEYREGAHSKVDQVENAYV